MSTKVKEDIWVVVRIADPRKAGVFNMGPYKDHQGKKRVLKDSNGNERGVKLNGNGKSMWKYNLANADDALLVEHIKHHPTYVKRPNPLLIVEDENARAEERLAYEEVSFEAKSIIKDLMGSDLANFARLFGIPTENSSEQTVRLSLIEYSDHDPERIVTEWANPQREYKELLRKGADKQLFNVDSKGVWKYNDILMGTSFEQALSWINDPRNEDLLPVIRNEVNKI